MKMLHTCLRVGNLEKSLDFYGNLGLREVSRKDHTKDGFILVYLSDEDANYELELTYNIGDNKYDLGTGFSHIALQSQNLEEDYKKHQQLGYELTPLKGLPGQEKNYYFVTDPDGYKVEIIRG